MRKIISGRSKEKRSLGTKPHALHLLLDPFLEKSQIWPVRQWSRNRSKGKSWLPGPQGRGPGSQLWWSLQDPFQNLRLLQSTGAELRSSVHQAMPPATCAISTPLEKTANRVPSMGCAPSSIRQVALHIWWMCEHTEPCKGFCLVSGG